MAEKITIDCWGQVCGESENYRIKPPCTVETDAPADGDGYIYRRYFQECPCAVQRDVISTAGGRISVKTQIAYGDWKNKANMDFVPLTPTLTVDRQTITASAQSFNATAGAAITGATVAASLLYGTVEDNATFAFRNGTGITGATISESGVLGGTVATAGTYTADVEISAPHAKLKVITITLNVS